MDQEFRLEIVYENNLDTDKFARMFNNKAQSYKFYWFEAILNLSLLSDMRSLAYGYALSSQALTNCEWKCREFSGACHQHVECYGRGTVPESF